MSTERDTHFQGFAQLLYSDLANLFLVMYSYSTDEEEQFAMAEAVIKDVLARRAYDLVYNSLEFTRTSPDPRTMQLSSTEVWMHFIPDLDAWPKPD